MERRGLSPETIERVLLAPEQREQVRPGRDVLQSRGSAEKSEKVYLVRVFVDLDREPAEVVTAYRTTKLRKYWREET